MDLPQELKCSESFPNWSRPPIEYVVRWIIKMTDLNDASVETVGLRQVLELPGNRRQRDCGRGVALTSCNARPSAHAALPVYARFIVIRKIPFVSVFSS